MSESTAEAPATQEGAEPQAEGDQQQPQQPQLKPTETVEFWKQKAREQEQRAKANKSAADRLAEIEESQKSEAEKVADRLRKADAELAGIPSKVSEALKTHLISLHQISDEDSELFLTAADPEVLLKQVTRLIARDTATAAASKKQGNHVPGEGKNPTAPESDERETVRRLFGG